MADLPEYDSPPVVETVLGVQFTPLPWTAAHAGWYWRSYLGDGWPTVQEAPRLDDVFEKFGAEKAWRPPGGQLRLMSKPEAARVQLIREDGERMLQVQDSRFIYNWKKKSGEYPTYRRLLPEFRQHLEQFGSFLTDARLPALALNQWEVIYVNHVPIGDLWNSPRDWPAIFPSVSRLLTDALDFESYSSVWNYAIDRDAGRLHVELRHAKKHGDDGTEVLRLQFTARGPLAPEGAADALFAGFDVGHRTIVNAFTNMTSDAAQKHWKRRK